MKKLNAFNVYYLPWTHPISNIKTFFRSVKYSYQRITRGFSDYDVWELDSYLSLILSETFKHLSKTNHGHPYDLSEDEWDNLLLDMSEKALQMSPFYEFDNEYEDELLFDYEEGRIKQDNCFDAWKDREDEINKCMVQCKDEVMEFLKERFYDLWD